MRTLLHDSPSLLSSDIKLKSFIPFSVSVDGTIRGAVVMVVTHTKYCVLGKRRDNRTSLERITENYCVYYLKRNTIHSFRGQALSHYFAGHNNDVQISANILIKLVLSIKANDK